MRKGYPLTAEELLLDPNRLRCPRLWALGKTAEQASLWLDDDWRDSLVREEKQCAQALPTVHWQTLMVLQNPRALHEGAGVGVPYLGSNGPQILQPQSYLGQNVLPHRPKMNQVSCYETLSQLVCQFNPVV